MTNSPEQPAFANYGINLVSPRLGSEVVFVSDEFFAPAARMLDDQPAIFIANKYDDHGKWMDGWESRRKRDPGHDNCIVRLGAKGTIQGIDVDTSHFTGNFPPAASLEACLSETMPADDATWREIVPSVSLAGDSHHFIAVADDGVYNYLKLNIFPDGGIARLRVYGRPVRDWGDADRDSVHELSALANGGRVVGYNDAHYGDPWVILSPGRGVNMGDGWETRRRRAPGHDWILIELGTPGAIERVEVDTANFKGNYPDRCSLQAVLLRGETDDAVISQSAGWAELLGENKLAADKQHFFEAGDLASIGAVSHVRLNIFPDGGIARLRLFGRPA